MSVIWLIDLDALEQRLQAYLRSRRKRFKAGAVARFRAIFIRSRGACLYCQSTVGPFQIDHITPIARGGPFSNLNLGLACRHCNVSKRYRTAAEFGHPEYHRFPPHSTLDDYETHRRATHRVYPSSHRAPRGRRR